MRRLFFLLLLLSLSACAPFVKDGQPATASTGVILQAGQTVGQTLLARDRGLQGIEIYLGPETPGSGEIQLHLRSDPQSSTDLAVSVLAVQSITAPGWVRFTFPPQNDSRQKDYYLHLKIKGPGSVRVETAPGDTYLDGALYQNKSPLDAQMTFRLIYDPGQLFLGTLTQAGSWSGILGIAIFLFILPGWALLALLWPGWDALAWGERLGLSAGMSLALYPLLFLWTNMIGLRLGPLYAWLPALAGLGVILWRNRKRLNVETFKHLNIQRLSWPDFTLLILLALVIFTRFWVIRSLDVPMWGDSYQHTMIAQLLVDHGGLFNSWLPYAELQTFTYHFGFHTAVAAFHWISGLDLPQSVLWTGQILNALAVLALYPLATRVGGNRWAGVGAVLLAGLLSPMPMYYVNWGRYTQLAGQVILPGAITLAWATLEAKQHRIESPVLAGKSNWSKWRRNIPFDAGRMALTWLILGGLALTHYRVLIFAVLFFGTFFILRTTRDTWRALLFRTFWLGAGAGLLFLPWFIHTFAGKILLIFSTQLSTPAVAVPTSTQQYNAIGNLSSYLPMALWWLLPVSVIWGLWRREKGVALVSLWWFMILLAANPQWLRLPGEGALSNFAIFIAAYIPVSVLAGYLLGQVASYKARPAAIGSADGLKVTSEPKFLAITLLILALVIGAWGARQRLRDFNIMAGALATRPDIRAAEWIQENTPQDARFLVNSFFAYGDTVIVGSDGGWWLPLLAQRQTTLPPLNYGSERGPRPDYVQWINALTTEIQNKGVAHPDALALLRERGVTHVYIGQRQGRVNYGGPYVLEPKQLLASPNFRLVYHQDRIWVFEIQR
ncbi:MAG: DUF1616 domain-containing protein [Anaerolineales bacterium]|nr:DUF1616 domain-containing protein [Anaerolineales bacterium]